LDDRLIRLLAVSIRAEDVYVARGFSLQRLFSTFASGWPGAGLLLQRLVTGTVLLHQGIVRSFDATPCALIVPQAVETVAGMLLLLGLWTPVAGTLVAIGEGWLLWSSAAEPVSSAMLAVLGATLAMIGPGAWSIDARVFGRRHIQDSEL
jgi:putative oxidoreductase